MDYFAHETAVIDEKAVVGEGTSIWHFTHVMGGARIGKNCTLGQNVFVAANVVVGDSVKIQNNVSIYEGVELENYVFCGPSMVFTNIIRPRCKYPQRGSHFYQRTIVREGASIGANATIVCGVEIGANSMVAAGSVVTKDVPPFTLVKGNPARFHCWICQCGNNLLKTNDIAYSCSACSRSFLIEQETGKMKTC